MAKRPSLQFYPHDWLGDKDLKRCTFHEKGIWIDVMCLFHQASEEEYGMLRWPLADIAEAAKCTVEDLLSLARKNVLKGSDTSIEALIYIPRSGRRNGPPVTLIEPQSGPLWYCKRMVRDEYVRRNSGGSGRFGASPSSSPEPSPSQRQGECQGEGQGARQGDGSSSSSSSSSSASLREEEERHRDSRSPPTKTVVQLTEEQHYERWLRVKKKYPAFAGKQDWINAQLYATNLVRNGEATWDEIEAGVERYARFCEATGTIGTTYVTRPGKFFSDIERPWAQDWKLPEKPRPAKPQSAVERITWRPELEDEKNEEGK